MHEFKDFDKWQSMAKKGKGTILAIHYCRVIFHNLWYSIFINICIVYALFANYLNIIIFDNRADVVFSAITIFVFSFFIFDFSIYLRGKFANKIRWQGFLPILLLLDGYFISNHSLIRHSLGDQLHVLKRLEPYKRKYYFQYPQNHQNCTACVHHEICQKLISR